jgi:GH24 family phage-related lysozyme (muramidase)
MNLVSNNLNEFLESYKHTDDIIPDELIDIFYKRIKERIELHGGDKNHPLVKKEIDRVVNLNGKLPDKIKDLLNECELYENLLLESLNEDFNIEKIKTVIEKIKDKKTLLNNLIKKFNETHNSKLKRYIASVLAILFITNFVLKNSQWSEVSSKSVNIISSEIVKKENINVPELIKIANVKIPGLFSMKTNKSPLIENAINVQFAKTSEETKNFIKDKEDLRLSGYELKDGKITIGWGHAEQKKTSKFKIGQKISEKQAQILFEKDILKTENAIKRMFIDWEAEGIKIKVTQNMFDAMVSLSYNMGITRFRNTEFAKHLKENNHIMAARDIKVAGTSSKYPGLISRRKQEYELFSKDLQKS